MVQPGEDTEGRSHQCLDIPAGCGEDGLGMDLLPQEDGGKVVTTRVKPLEALGYAGSTGGSSRWGGPGLSWSWPPVETSMGKLRPPAPPTPPLWKPLEPRGGP